MGWERGICSPLFEPLEVSHRGKMDVGATLDQQARLPRIKKFPRILVALVKEWEVVAENDDTPASVRVENIALRDRTVVRTDKTQVEDVQRRVKSLSKKNDNLMDGMVGCLGIDDQ